MEIPARIRDFYFRKTIAHPDGAMVHHGDCIFHTHKICGCGLLHALLPLPNAREIYARFDEDYNAQSLALDKLSQMP